MSSVSRKSCQSPNILITLKNEFKNKLELLNIKAMFNPISKESKLSFIIVSIKKPILLIIPVYVTAVNTYMYFTDLPPNIRGNRVIKKASIG